MEACVTTEYMKLQEKNNLNQGHRKFPFWKAKIPQI